eukprot:scaffold296326_cov44-Prasinocladus_malaysianus.AAC.1
MENLGFIFTCRVSCSAKNTGSVMHNIGIRRDRGLEAFPCYVPLFFMGSHAFTEIDDYQHGATSAARTLAKL